MPVPATGLALLGQMQGSGHMRPPSLVRRADGQTLQLTPLLYAVLGAIDGRRTYAEIGEVTGAQIGKICSADDVRYLIEEKLRPLGVLRDDDGAEPVTQRSNPLLALRWKAVVTNPAITRRITRPFATLFHPIVVAPVLIAFVAASVWLLFTKGLGSAMHEALYEPGMLLLVLALTMASAGFHEFGHAAACRYGGATPGAMGVGLYLLWPAFYTEVSDSYRLSRSARVRVDLGGLYFNAIFALGMLGVWAITRSDGLLLLIPAQLLQMARQLLPFVRFDGYHILADLIGVPDLFAHLKPTLLSMLPTRWRRPQPQQLKRWARVLVTTWVLLVIPVLLFSLFLMVTTFPRVAATAWDSLGERSQLLAASWRAGSATGVAGSLFTMFALALPLVSMVYLLSRIVRRTGTRVWRATEDRPKSRFAAVLAAGALTTLLAWWLWPQGQYRPIEANERLTVQDGVTAAAGAQWVVLDDPDVVLADVFTQTAPGFAEISDTDSLPDGVSPRPRLGIVVSPREPESDEPPRAIVLPERSTVSPQDDTDPWPFPFNPPAPPGEGDNQALAVNTKDGTAKYDVSLAMVWVTDGEAATQANEAYAVASCTRCSTVAVAFQTIFVIGQSDTVIPQNIAVAVNYACDTCTTYALAVQLVATLTRMPSDDAMERLNAVWAELEALADGIEDVPLSELREELTTIEAKIVKILTDDGALQLPGGTAADSASATDDGAADDEEDGGTEGEATADGEPGDAPEEPAAEDSADDAVADDDDAEDETVSTDSDDEGDTSTAEEPAGVDEDTDEAAAEPTPQPSPESTPDAEATEQAP